MAAVDYNQRPQLAGKPLLWAEPTARPMQVRQGHVETGQVPDERWPARVKSAGSALWADVVICRSGRYVASPFAACDRPACLGAQTAERVLKIADIPQDARGQARPRREPGGRMRRPSRCALTGRRKDTNYPTSLSDAPPARPAGSQGGTPLRRRSRRPSLRRARPPRQLTFTGIPSFTPARVRKQYPCRQLMRRSAD
jgi:hypothetical protein